MNVQATDRVLVDGKLIAIGSAVAHAYRDGDRIVASSNGELLIIPKSEIDLVEQIVHQSQVAFTALQTVDDEQIRQFFAVLARRIADDDVMDGVFAANREDIQRAKERGRSTTRLELTASMRKDMIAALGLWRDMVVQGDTAVQFDHAGWSVQSHHAPLGIVGFVFEGRPNVLADATGVLRGRNTCVFRIGSDAFSTAEALMNAAVRPSLSETGLPEHCVMLLPSISHASAWALFSNRSVALAVARGSGQSVALLGNIAQQHGIPVSLHGTGGAWALISRYDDLAALQDVISHSLDRKVCNTLNTIVVLDDAIKEMLPSVIIGIAKSGEKLGVRPIVHLSASVEQQCVRLGIDLRELSKDVVFSVADDLDLSKEWEWETTPEVTILFAESIVAATELFNTYSPQFVVSVLTSQSDEEEYVWSASNAPFFGNGMTRWVDGQYALNKPELGLSNWQLGRTLARGGILSGDSVFSIRYRMTQRDSSVKR